MDKFQLRFNALYEQGKGYTFPCDKDGKVDISSMSASEIESYALVHVLTGLEYSYPVKEPK